MLTGLLAAMAFMSISTFYNFGHPQFFDSAEGRNPRMSTPGTCACTSLREVLRRARVRRCVPRERESLRGRRARRIAELGSPMFAAARPSRLRDASVADVADEIHAVEGSLLARTLGRAEARTCPTSGRRWDSGTTSSSLRDHGGNATPAWLLVGLHDLRLGGCERSDVALGRSLRSVATV